MIEESGGHGLSEAEVEAQMYQAMAERMQSDGLEVTPEEIRNVVDEVSEPSESPAELDEKDEQILSKMADYQEEYLRANPTYVVRGALLRCNYGSHCRRLNMPRCHGVYVLQHPMMHKRDCVAGTEGPELNIRTFGICSCPSNPSGGHVILEKEAPRDPVTWEYTGAPAEGTVSGIPCVPSILGEWESPHEDSKIGAEHQGALTTQSFLVCEYGGLIEVLRSGQEDEE